MLEEVCPTCKSSSKDVRHPVFSYGGMNGMKRCDDWWHVHRNELPPSSDVTVEPEFREFMCRLEQAFQIPLAALQLQFQNLVLPILER